MVGPNLHGVIGRKAGSLAGYIYSDAMKKADWSWDPKHLDTWLANPGQMVEGTKMTFVGLPEAKDRIDVIAYLRSNGSTSYPIPPPAPAKPATPAAGATNSAAATNSMAPASNSATNATAH